MWFQCLFFVAVAASIAPLMQAPHYLLQAYQRVQVRTNEVTAAMQQLAQPLPGAQQNAVKSEIIDGICWRRVRVGTTVLISASCGHAKNSESDMLNKNIFDEDEYDI